MKRERLSAEARAELERIVKKGKGGAHRIRNAQLTLPRFQNVGFLVHRDHLT
jgi:hypothetical protein